MRTLCWFSCGAASAVATQLALRKYPDLIIACCTIANEHEDNERFLKDCEDWYGREILRLKSDKYKDAWDVWEKTKWLVGPKGARCTTELKKSVRHKFQLADDIQIFGFTFEERDRESRFRKQNFEVILESPLIENKLTKQDCFNIVQEAGIELPAMYKLGYKNNNCIGCVKGQAGYRNKINKDLSTERELVFVR